ncbi:flagellar FlbD family protein [Vallicoccus soli]|uniref:Flagellar protein FlbD n=1 Tax=Vallicoccus soli TaxID=2339232 RepID=A0A3A3ZCC8_9ACTN|nr:flagellar FlbD family protein [Vallicoccus soli]RJK92810.1 flagellar protein FlbD [Vallicoccus soli]
MIVLTRLNGPAFAVNPDLIQRAEGTPDTVLTLVDGTRYVVVEPVEEVVARIRDFRASVIATAHALEAEGTPPAPAPHPAHPTAAGETASIVVPLHRREL